MNYGLLGITAKELEEEINNARIDYLVYSTLKNLEFYFYYQFLKKMISYNSNNFLMNNTIMKLI